MKKGLRRTDKVRGRPDAQFESESNLRGTASGSGRLFHPAKDLLGEV